MPVYSVAPAGGLAYGLYRHECAAAILIHPHRLLVAKLKAYGLSTGAVGLLDSYLSDRKQQIRLGYNTSSWKNLLKEFFMVLFRTSAF